MKLRTSLYVTFFVLALCLAIALIVLWNIYIINDYLTIEELRTALYGGTYRTPATGRWTVLVLGSSAWVFVIVFLSLFFAAVMRSNRSKQQQRDFTNMMTHELRLPLSAIQVFAQTLRQRPLEAEERNRFADGILAECARLGQLIDQLVKIQQIEHGQLLLNKKNLEGARFLAEFALKWPRPLNWKAEASPRIHADPLLLEMVLANFLTNAEKYGRGTVPELALTRDGGYARFSVRDGGRPIPRRYLRRVFRKFYRMPDLNTRRQSGVGLGLYIVDRIARLHKGRAGVLPLHEPPGNEFFLRIPARGESPSPTA